MIHSIAQFGIGFTSVVRGFQTLATTKRLWKYATIPFIVSFLLFGGFLWIYANLSKLAFQGQLDQWFSSFEMVRDAAKWVAIALLSALSIVGAFFSSFVLAKILVSPFNSLLAEKTLTYLGVLKSDHLPMAAKVKLGLKMFWISLLRTLVLLPVGVILFTLSFIPVLNILTFGLVLLLLSFDVVDYSFEALQMGLKERFRYFFRNFAAFLGFAAALGLVFFIPGANFFLFPAAVIGGSQLISQIEKRR